VFGRFWGQNWDPVNVRVYRRDRARDRPTVGHRRTVRCDVRRVK